MIIYFANIRLELIRLSIVYFMCLVIPPHVHEYIWIFICNCTSMLLTYLHIYIYVYIYRYDIMI